MSTGYVYSVRTNWVGGNHCYVSASTGSTVLTVSATALTLGDGYNIAAGTTTGTQIGTAAAQKLGFYGKTPVVQRAKADYSNWSALSNVVQALVDLGLFDAA